MLHALVVLERLQKNKLKNTSVYHSAKPFEAVALSGLKGLWEKRGSELQFKYLKQNT